METRSNYVARGNGIIQDCSNIPYKSNPDLQRWLLAHLGIIEFQNREPGAQSAISLWQVSKLFLDELVPHGTPGRP
jgi:hypothetical protein